MLVLNLAILVLLVAGHTELIVAAINRLHAPRLPVFFLKWTRRLHDLVIVAFPFVLVGQVGLISPGVLRGGSWSDLPFAWSVYLSLCVLGFLFLCVSAIRWWLAAPPAVLESNHTETVDVAEVLGRKPLGHGRYRSLARLPWNEVFRIQFTEKTLRHPRLPAEWDGLSILHLSDMHILGTIDRPYFDYIFERLARWPADLAVFTGDLFDNLALSDWLDTTLARIEAPLGRYFILGNHDWYLDPPLIRQHLDRRGWTDVAGRAVSVQRDGLTLAIGGSEQPWMGAAPDFSSVPDAAFRLFLSHTPDNLTWAREHAVDLMLSGHNHGGQVVLPVIGPVYSPSRYGVRYASGTFWEPPTLLHVSRGLSGRYPLRWHCSPEATRIILRRG